MASLVLGAVGAVVGSAVGGPTGAAWGWNIGVTLGGVLFPPKLGEQDLGKLDDLKLSGSGYGAMIPQVWGKVRIGGNVIWTTNLTQHVQRKKQKSKGGGGQTTQTYSYTASFAVAVCRGPATVKRIWAEDILIYDASASPESKYDITLYEGNETQTPDPLMTSIIGAGLVPAHRGLCYIVFEDLLLTDWGNRIPNLSFEVETDAQTVETILSDLSTQSGILPGDMDYTTATDVVDGFVLAQRASVRDVIDPLLRIFATDITEFGGQVKTIKRGSAPVFTLTEDEIGAVSTNNTEAFDRVSTRVVMDTDLPSRLDLTYFSSSRLYQQMTQSSVRQTKGLVDEATTINSLLVLTENLARQVAERLIYTTWLERTTFQFALGPKFMRLGPGDIVLMPINGQQTRVRIVSRDAGLFGELRFSGTLDESDVLTQTASGGTSPVVIPPLQTLVDTHFKAWSCPIMRDMDRDFPGFYVAATGPNQWHGCTVYYSTDLGVTWIEGGTITDRSVIGETVNALPDGTDPLEVDTLSTLQVTLTDTGELESTSQPNVDSGENASLVGDEVLGFRTATPTGALDYDLTNLTRGFRNTDMTGHVIGERFVVLEETAIRVEVPWSLVGTTVRVKCVSDGQALGSVSYYQDVLICNPTAVNIGGRMESWIVEASDSHLSNSDRTYTRDLTYNAQAGTLWLAVRGLMRHFATRATLSLDGFGNPKTVSITFPAGQEFATDDEIGIWYFELGSPILAMKKVKFTVTVAGNQIITIPEIPVKGSLRVWVRERWIKKESFNVPVGTDQLTITNGTMDIQPGDFVEYAYIPSSAPVTNYFEDLLFGVDGQQAYDAIDVPVIIGAERSYIIDVGGRIDPDATIGDDGGGFIKRVTLAVDMTSSSGIPVTIRRYS